MDEETKCGFAFRFINGSLLPINLPPIQKISCASTWTAVLTQSGEVYTWGTCAEGGLGLGKGVTYAPEPTLVTGPIRECKIKDIATGDLFLIVVTQNEEVWQCGRARAIPPASINDISKVWELTPRCVSGRHKTKMSVSGHVYTSAGDSYCGILYARGTKVVTSATNSTPFRHSTYTPLPLKKYFAYSDMGPGGAYSYTFLLDIEGTLYTVGTDREYRLGLGEHNYLQYNKHWVREEEPVKIPALCGKKIVDVAQGVSHVVALSEMGELFVWGKGPFGKVEIPRLVGNGFSCISTSNSQIIISKNDEIFKIDPQLNFVSLYKSTTKILSLATTEDEFYTLLELQWSRNTHKYYPTPFKKAVHCIILGSKRKDCLFHCSRLPPDILYSIIKVLSTHAFNWNEK